MRECQKIEEEYGQNPENFEDVTIYRNSIPFTRLAPILDIDIAFACDVLKRVERYLKNGEGDINVLEYFGYGDDIDGLFSDGISWTHGGMVRRISQLEASGFAIQS